MLTTTTKNRQVAKVMNKIKVEKSEGIRSIATQDKRVEILNGIIRDRNEEIIRMKEEISELKREKIETNDQIRNLTINLEFLKDAIVKDIKNAARR